MMRQYELVERVKAYEPGADEDLLNRAYVFAMQAHGSQTRASGDPYFSHPIEVAGILTRYRLDAASIVTALLHDTIEDTATTREEIETLFGAEVAALVEGVTKLSRIEMQSDESRQAENFRKLVLAMSKDLRVLLVKLADRLHNMRTLHFINNPDKRKRIARETMDIYAPLAQRIGMRDVQEELEDLAFAELNPDARQSILNRLEFLREQGGDLITHVIDELEKLLAEEGVEAEVKGREKTPYSIFKKMQRQNVAFEQLSDLMAFRIVVEDVAACYRALGAIHSRYSVVPGRFKDYISVPKPNGYQSLHTGVFGPEHQRIEVQIRTREMNEVCEHGVAAHWHYKQGTGGQDGTQYRWLRELLDVLEHAAGPEEFLEHTRLEMFKDQVFAFTPKGDLHALPRGATPVDFAYAIHTEVGDRTVGAKVNGRMAPLRTELRNGDQVEIITAKNGKPSPEWERFVATGKARACIRRFIRASERDQYIELGKSILEKAFRAEGHELTHKALEGAIGTFKCDSVEDLFAAVGEGRQTGREVAHTVFPPAKPRRKPKIAATRRKRGRAKDKADGSIEIRGLIPGMAVHFAGCCHPIPGDRIVGLVTTGKGITIHTIDCETLEAFVDEPERWLDVAWEHDAAETHHVGRLNVILLNEPGSLGNLSTIIGKNEGNISNLKITNRTTDFFDMLIDIEVRDVRHLSNIIAALRAAPMINSVERARH